MPKTYFYHKSTCTSCRKGKAILDRKGINYQAVEIFKNPLSRAELESLIPHNGIDGLLSKRSKAFKELGLENLMLTKDEVLVLMLTHPTMIKRPITKHGKQILIGFKQDLFEELE